MSEKQIPVQPKHKDGKKETLTGHALWAGGLPDAGCVCVSVCVLGVRLGKIQVHYVYWAIHFC